MSDQGSALSPVPGRASHTQQILKREAEEGKKEAGREGRKREGKGRRGGDLDMVSSTQQELNKLICQQNGFHEPWDGSLSSLGLWTHFLPSRVT
jgi:hypothetical protein